MSARLPPQRLEGRISVAAALEARIRRIDLLCVAHGTHVEKLDELLDLARERGVPVKEVADGELDRMAGGVTHGGLVALCGPRPPTRLEDLIASLRSSASPASLLLLEGVEDAQNLGFTLRSAEALGAHGVLLKKHLWDFDEAALTRAASGAWDRLPVVKVERDGDALQELRAQGCALWGCLANAKRTMHEVDLRGPVILAIGGEKRGLSGAVRSQCDGMLRIPMTGPAGSLALYRVCQARALLDGL
ncbi:MAG: RNA methyltransferase, partial [Planctomycetes bacterium]|nr:RNA methyltransferase [Planctomycetota bacterium]